MTTADRTDRTDAVTIVRGEEEVWRRTSHLFERATSITCAANRVATWGFAHGMSAPHPSSTRIRKVFRSGTLLDPAWRRTLSHLAAHPGVSVRVTPDELNETIILDERVAILAGDERDGRRSYSLITARDTVRGVMSLFEAAWRSSADLAVYDARVAEIRELAPRVLDLLGSGVKDEVAARELGLGVRTYRRRVAELMDALGADSRFQAGVRARELGLV